MENYSITLEDDPSPEAREIFNCLHEYNTSKAGESGYQELNLFLRDARGSAAGGLRGSTSRGWLHVSLLVVKEELRGQGWGSKLLAEAEREAIHRGCTGAYLDTFSFQARPFYQKQGYIIFGTLEDYPPGHCRYFMRKPLVPFPTPQEAARD